MNIISHRLSTRLLTGLLACGLALPASAQQEDRPQPDRQRQARQQQDDQDRARRDGDRRDKDRRDGDRQDRVRRDRAEQDGDRREGTRRLAWEPAGWVRVAVDTDGDGRFDTVETIYAFDLETARKQSRGRKAQMQRSSQPQDRPRPGDEPRRVQVQGDIQELREIKMRGEDHLYMIGRVKTEDGRVAKVLFGRKQQLAKLDLSEGDPVKLRGRRGTINGRGVLVATAVQSADQQVRIDLKPQVKQRLQARQERPQQQRRERPKTRERGNAQVTGEVVRSRRAKFRGHDATYLVAEIRSEEGDRCLVNLGPQAKFEEIDFDDVDRVEVTGHQGKISGDDALIAESVKIDGETIDVKSDERRDRRWRRQTQREQPSQDRDDRDRRDGRPQAEKKDRVDGDT